MQRKATKTLGICGHFGLRWQPAEAKRSEDWSAAATPLFDCGRSFQSGVALRFPPQSKKTFASSRLCAFALKNEMTNV
jgi:hypothetical protein